MFLTIHSLTRAVVILTAVTCCRVAAESENTEDSIEVYGHEESVKTTRAVNEQQIKTWRVLQESLNLAYEEGDYQKALEVAKQSHETAIAYFDSDDAKAQASMFTLASLYEKVGQYDTALILCQQLLNSIAKSHSIESIEYLSVTIMLSRLLLTNGNIHEAEKIAVKASTGINLILGDEHSISLEANDNLASIFQAQGRLLKAESLQLSTYNIAVSTLGIKHPQSLMISSNLADLYHAMGRYEDAVKLQRSSVNIAYEILGVEHPQTQTIVNNLAVSLKKLSKYEEAESLYKEALNISQKAFGQDSPVVLRISNNLAALDKELGRYAKAARTLEDLVDRHSSALGSHHPDTLISINNLSNIYVLQGKLAMAEALLIRTLNELYRTFGGHHPGYIVALGNLGVLYLENGKYTEAESMFKKSYDLNLAIFGDSHPNTQKSKSNLASTYLKLERFSEAELLFKAVIAHNNQFFGSHHIDTLESTNHLAVLYHQAKKYSDALPIFKLAFERAFSSLGAQHPLTTRIQLNYADALIVVGHIPDAVNLLRESQPYKLGWIATEMLHTPSYVQRNKLVLEQTIYQDKILSLALKHPSAETLMLAGDVVMRSKYIQGEEEAHLASLVRIENDTELLQLVDQVASERARLATLAFSQSDPHTLNASLEALETLELQLSNKSGGYRQYLQASRPNLSQIQSDLPDNSALVEFRRYRPYNFERGTVGVDRWVVLFVRKDGTTFLADAGEVEQTQRLMPTDSDTEKALSRSSATELYSLLFGNLNNSLATVDIVFVAADGFLNLIPFEQLITEKNTYWGEEKNLRFIYSGRDLLGRRNASIPDSSTSLSSKSTVGFLALGDPDYDLKQNDDRQGYSGSLAIFRRDSADQVDTDLQIQLSDFPELPYAREEVEGIAAMFKARYPSEPLHVWLGEDATEHNLKKTLKDNRVNPPRILHIASHGFYLPQQDSSHSLPRPLLNSGIALSGANHTIQERNQGKAPKTSIEDGILYGIEAQSLDLEGTELVVLSACDTGIGFIDYSEGVTGLVRAFRTAGARDVLMALWPVGDKATSIFMQKFYEILFSLDKFDPATALASTKAWFRNHELRQLRDPNVWAAYVLIEG